METWLQSPLLMVVIMAQLTVFVNDFAYSLPANASVAGYCWSYAVLMP